LLLAGPVKMPLLGVDMTLFAFYGFAPPLFVVLHLYVLMQLYLLARLLRLFDDDLRAADMIEQDRRRVHGQLDKFVLTPFLIGAPQDMTVRLFLYAVVLLSFVAGPVLLLLSFQLRFLPYHNVQVTYAHRGALLLDVIMLLLLWPRVSRSSAPRAKLARNWKALCRVGVAALISAMTGRFLGVCRDRSGGMVRPASVARQELAHVSPKPLAFWRAPDRAGRGQAEEADGRLTSLWT
jgi:hypothetical protein